MWRQKRYVFYEAQQTVLERMMGAEYQPPDSQPIFHIVIADKEDMVDPETLANRIITVSQTDVEEADGVYIEGVPLLHLVFHRAGLVGFHLLGDAVKRQHRAAGVDSPADGDDLLPGDKLRPLGGIRRA
mgnify:CR=1 FL=1